MCSLALMFSVYSDVPFFCEHPNKVTFMPPILQCLPHYTHSKHANTKLKLFINILFYYKKLCTLHCYMEKSVYVQVYENSPTHTVL